MVGWMVVNLAARTVEWSVWKLAEWTAAMMVDCLAWSLVGALGQTLVGHSVEMLAEWKERRWAVCLADYWVAK